MRKIKEFSRMASIRIAIIFIIVLCSVISHSASWYKILYVSDGDTVAARQAVEGRISGELIRIRLFGIDAPEINQEYGYESKEALMGLIRGKFVEVEEKGKDRYGRLIGIIYLDGRNINEEMIKTGNAWWYEEYDRDNNRARKYQENAKKNKKGIFLRKGYEFPWEFRKRKKGREVK